MGGFLMSRVSRALVVAVTVLGSLLASTSVALAWEPTGGATFNNPRGNHAARWRIIDKIIHSIKSTPRGQTIMMSTFLLDSPAVGDALIAAHNNRNVKVQVVLDGDIKTATARRIANVMNRDNVAGAAVPLRWGPDQSFVVFCDGSCRGVGGNDHTKFYLFSRTGTANDVVMISSGNLNKGAANRGWNDSYTIKGRTAIYNDFAGIHREMSQDTARDGDRYREFVRGGYISRFYPKPSGSDPVLDDLGKVHCLGANGGAGRSGHTAINISMFAWNDDRGWSIARKLVSLAGQGCAVSIIYGAPAKDIGAYLRDKARSGLIKLWDSRYDLNGDGIDDVRTHEKYMLINGHYGSDHSAWRVHTGSQNWGRGTLSHGDENTLTIVSRRAYARYIDNWDTIRLHGSRRLGG
jgi:phosphatidylserine/phosphatidylglycerophosphate/cardiolipin synthase-like enzyme